MGRTKKLWIEIRAHGHRAYPMQVLREYGQTVTQIARRFSVTLSCEVKTLKRIDNQGNYASKHRPGRPRVTFIRDDRSIAR